MKTVNEIFEEMCAVFTQQSGMQVPQNSELAVRLYAVSAQIYGLYLQNEWTANQCFPQTAQGLYLDYHAQLRNLSRNAAAKAQGRILFSLAQASTTDLILEKGIICMTSGLVRFETTEVGRIPAGTLRVEVAAQAVEEGSGGNVAAETIRLMSLPPVGIQTCSNPAPFLGGVELEEDESLRQRILSSYRRMPNGANAAYYEAEALRFPEVVAARVLPKTRGTGTVDLVIATATGAPSATLLEQVRTQLAKKREIAVDLQVLAPTAVSVQVQIKISVQKGWSFQPVAEQVKQCISSHFDGRILGKPLLRAQLGDLIFRVEGVENYSILSPAADLLLQPKQLAVLQQVSVEVLS